MYKGDDNIQDFRNTRPTRVCVNPISQSAVRAETVTQTASGHPVCASEKVKAALLAVRRLKFKITALAHSLSVAAEHDSFWAAQPVHYAFSYTYNSITFLRTAGVYC